MKIIKKGKTKCLDYIEYVRKCWNCKCEFTYTYKDWINNVFQSDYLCDLVYCPKCGTRNNIKCFLHKIYKKHYRELEE